MIYMLFTNKHPNGLSKEKALNKNTSSSKFKSWAFSAKINLENEVIKKLINKSLNEEPSTRPSVKEFYNILKNELKKLDMNAYYNLKLRFDYFDYFNQIDASSKEIGILKKLSKLHQNNEIYNQVIRSIPIMLNEVNSEKNLIRVSEYYKLLISLAKKNEQDKNKLIEYSKKLIELLYKWHSKIKVKHKYPENKFQNKIIFKTPDIRDIEITSQYINVIYNFLCKYIEKNKIKELFKQYNNDIFYSIFLYSKASLMRLSDMRTCISLLDEARRLNPKELLFEYMKYLWIQNSLMSNKNENIKNIKNDTYKNLKNNYQNWKAIDRL